MPFSQKTVYALRAVFELSKRSGTGPVTIAAIAEAQAVPVRFLENILLQLKGAGILDSARGREGGYWLAREPEMVSVVQVLRAMEISLVPVSCLGGKLQEHCPMQQSCPFLPMWERAHQAMLGVYDSTSFADLLEQEASLSQGCGLTFSI